MGSLYSSFNPHIRIKMSSNDVVVSINELREDLIGKAVSFLTSPKVAGHPQSQKEAFLKSRGLTNEEISAAMERCGAKTYTGPNTYQFQPVLHTVSPFQKFREILHTIALLSGVTYGVYYFIKKVILPFLFGKPKKPTGVEAAVLDLSNSVKDSVSQLRSDVQKIQTDLERVVAVQHEQQVTVRNLGDIKSEVATVKGILLSRNQFPSVPLTGSASIPAWQMAACADPGDRSSEVQNSNGGSQNSDSSLEMIKEVDVAEADA